MPNWLTCTCIHICIQIQRTYACTCHVYMLIWLCDMHAHTNAYMQKHAHTKIIINTHLITIYAFFMGHNPISLIVKYNIHVFQTWGDWLLIQQTEYTYTEIFTSAEIRKTNNVTTEMQSHTYISRLYKSLMHHIVYSQGSSAHHRHASAHCSGCTPMFQWTVQVYHPKFMYTL